MINQNPKIKFEWENRDKHDPPNDAIKVSNLTIIEEAILKGRTIASIPRVYAPKYEKVEESRKTSFRTIAGDY